MSQLIGQSIGRYHILEQLGAGGMAIVYKAHDTRLEADVAVKVIRTEKLTEETKERSLKRFEREAKSLARLTHPNIVKVTDYGEYEGKPFLVMPYLPGGTLKSRLVGRPMPWREAIQLLLPMADALAYAHNHDIIHRDIKPSNILITEKGQTMLSDFGVAKFLDVEDTQDLTGTNAAIGTPEYMAPEQITSKSVDARVDIYALGIVLYELITGRKPFVADTPLGVMFKHASEPLPVPQKYVPDLPAGVGNLLLKALAKNPAERYRDMRELAEAMADLQASQGRQAVRGPELKATGQSPTHRTGENSFTKTRPGKLVMISSLIVIAVAGFFGIPALVDKLQTASQPTNSASTESLALVQAIDTPTLPSTPTHAPTIRPTSLPARITDGKGIEMVLVPEGEFVMGSDQYENESPAHSVFLEAYYLDQYEVTNASYKMCVDEGVCIAPQKPESAMQSDYFGNSKFDNFPVVYVDWYMAQTYCEWRGGFLPSEAMWEKAARGTEMPSLVFPWGEEIDETFANYNQNLGDTTAIGSYENGKSVYGAYDMAGNVWEWVSSLYEPYPYDAADGREDLNATAPRVLRGGSWINMDKNLRTTSRLRGGPTNTTSYMGFRCSRSPQD